MIHFVNEFPGRIISNHGEDFIYFGGTAYLGIQTDIQFQNLFVKNIKKYGTNYAASRKSNIRFNIYAEAEKFLQKLVGSDWCKTVSSGFLAGQMVSSYFHKKNFDCFFAPNTHAALHFLKTKNSKSFKVFKDEIITALKKYRNEIVIFCDSIEFQGYNYPNFSWLYNLPHEKIILVVDDSHGLGIIGVNGGGIYRQLKRMNFKKLIVCGSLGKGFGIAAGAIFGKKETLEAIISQDMYAASSPATPASIATLLDAHSLYLNKRILLKEHIHFFTENSSRFNLFQYMLEYPTFNYNDKRLTEFLYKHKIIVTNFKYPNEDAPTVSRIVLCAHHTKQDIIKLLETIKAYFLTK